MWVWGVCVCSALMMGKERENLRGRMCLCGGACVRVERGKREEL